MTLCCIPYCFACADAVRWCPRCNASFAVCATHRHSILRCPWPANFMIPCSALVPPDRSWSTPMSREPMYLRQDDFVTAWFPEKEPAIECVATSTRGHPTDTSPSAEELEGTVGADQCDI